MKNGTFEFREMINRVPEAGVSKSTYWDGEDGEWGLVDETLVLGDLGRLDIEDGEVILTFFLDSFKPKQTNEASNDSKRCF